MEKYSVDYQADEVEVRANELIKQGSLTDLTEARLAAQKEKEVTDGSVEQFQHGEGIRNTYGGTQ